MCDKCDQIQQNLATMSEDQLSEHHFDLTIELSEIAREISNLQRRAYMLTDRVEEIELIWETKRPKENEPISN